MKNGLLLLSLVISLFGFSQIKYSKVKIFVTNEELPQLIQAGISVDHGSRKNNTWLITDLSTDQIEHIQSIGFSTEIMIDDVQQYYVERNLSTTTKTERTTCNTDASSDPVSSIQTPTHFNLGSMGGFYTYQEFLDELDEMATAYPDLITSRAAISTYTTHEGRPVYWVKISDNPNSDETEAEVLYTALHHAREPQSLTQLIYYMWYVLENYGSNEEVTYLVDHTEMFFIPMINPDGYVENETTDPNGGGMHRKNKRNVGTTNPGVDLNRNYSYHWGESGVSTNTNDDTYPGTAAFTEPETQAVKWFCENHEFEFAMNAHTYGNQLLYPIGWATNEFAADHNYFHAYTNHQVLFNDYLAQKSSALYPASGDSDDWMYIDDLSTKPSIFATTPEIGSDDDGFWPATNRIIPICKENIWQNLILAHLPHIYAYSSDLEASKIENTSGYFNYEIERLGQENGDVTVSMEAIEGISSFGNSNTHTLALMQVEEDSISYTLSSNIAFGDPITFVLKTDNGTWTRKDTIYKTYGAGDVIFSDAVNNLDYWTGDWDLTYEYYYSSNYSITDSPNNEYNNGSETECELNNSIDLSLMDYAYIQFYARWDIEADYDFVEFMVSTDDGNNWSPLCGKYTNLGNGFQDYDEPLYDGTQTDWVLEEIDLTDYLGLSHLKFKFRLVSDNYVTEDGFAFDDFKIFAGQTNNLGLNSNKLPFINIYPNPTQDFVTIQSENGGMNEIKIQNQLGQTVYTYSNQTSALTIETKNWAKGVYFIQVTNEQQHQITKKIIIQ